jgi:hypothetical protein
MKTKKPLGSKITENKNIENQIVLWIEQDNDISDYEINKRLKEKFSVKISQPTIKKWRVNFYKELKNNNVVVVNSDIKELDLKHEQLHNLLNLLKDFNERKVVIKGVLDEKTFTNKDGKVVARIDTFIEGLYKDYLNSIINLEDKILKYTSGANPFSIAREVMEKITKYILTLFIHYKVSDEDINKFKEFLKDLDTEFYIKYNVDTKK